MGTKVDTDLISDDIIFHSFISFSLSLSSLFYLGIIFVPMHSLYTVADLGFCKGGSMSRASFEATPS